MGGKADNQQFRDACNELGMTPAERSGFSDYVHDLKQSGERGTAIDRGDYTWEELLGHARDFLEEVRN